MDSDTAIFLTIAVVIAEGLVACYDGTFSSIQRKHVNLSFLKHWGVSIGDLFIFPLINAFIIPRLNFNLWYILGFVLALVITLLCHRAWWPGPQDENAQGFILMNNPPLLPTRHCFSKSYWYLAITRAGWIHIFFMTCQLAILGGYILTPMPRPVVNAVSLLLAVFLPLGVIEPGIVQSGGIKKLTLRKCAEISIIFLALMTAIFVIRFIKIS
ncbi:MAG: hypothetical protein NTY33_02985 [Candidatus Moranbacteria bacterium]|nr:hypothetical protein [Candidatus Moranbacteria bacterium]